MESGRLASKSLKKPEGFEITSSKYLRETKIVTAGKNIIVCILIVSFILAFQGCGWRRSYPEIGVPAPIFKLKNLDGQEISLDQFKGKIVLLDFWATWCGPCRMAMPELEKLAKEYPDSMVLLAINMQEPEEDVRGYVHENAIGSQVLLDKDGSTSRAYGAYAIPMYFLIDKTGVLRHIQAGYKSNMASQLRALIETLRQD